MCALLLSHVQLFVTPWTVVCQTPLSMGILQARILEWVAMHSARGSSQPRDQTCISHVPALVVGFFTTSNTWKLRGMPKTKYLQVLSQWNLLAAPWEAVIFYYMMWEKVFFMCSYVNILPQEMGGSILVSYYYCLFFRDQ